MVAMLWDWRLDTAGPAPMWPSAEMASHRGPHRRQLKDRVRSVTDVKHPARSAICWQPRFEVQQSSKYLTTVTRLINSRDNSLFQSNITLFPLRTYNVGRGFTNTLSFTQHWTELTLPTQTKQQQTSIHSRTTTKTALPQLRTPTCTPSKMCQCPHWHNHH